MTIHPFLSRALPALAILLIPCASPRAQAPAPAPNVCGATASCTEVRTFAATAVDFRTSTQGRVRLVTVTLRLRNKLNRPLTLGYVWGSGIVTDDQGNRYQIGSAASVRGIGSITNNVFDPKFTLQPGEASDARFEFAWQPAANQIFGTRFDLELAIREIDPLPASQYRLGREHALQLRGFGAPTVASTTTASSGGGQDGDGDMPPPEEVNPCDGRTRCFSDGPFIAEVLTLTPSRVGRHHVIRLNVRFRNLTRQPLVLAYTSGSSAGTDNLGNRYTYGRPGTHDGSVKGMGLITRGGADARFAMRPGESRNATFELVRFNAAGASGTEYTVDFAVEQLEVLPGNQVRSVRQFSASFPGLTEGSSAEAAAVQTGSKLIDALKKKLEKP